MPKALNSKQLSVIAKDDQIEAYKQAAAIIGETPSQFVRLAIAARVREVAAEHPDADIQWVDMPQDVPAPEGAADE